MSYADDQLNELTCTSPNQPEFIANFSSSTEKYGMAKNYAAGANITGFLKVADAMLSQGIV